MINPPNLAGDEVSFVRKDAQGNVISWGHMHPNSVQAEREAGVNIEIVETPYVKPPPADNPRQLIAIVAQVLSASDHYFLADSDDNISEDERGKWRIYRQTLRDAAKKSTRGEILGALPTSDPKGIDRFELFR